MAPSRSRRLTGTTATEENSERTYWATVFAELASLKNPRRRPNHLRPSRLPSTVYSVYASEKRSPKTLEETLEILGADQLQIEGAKKKPASGGEVRHLDVKVQKNSAFSRLLDRLAERSR